MTSPDGYVPVYLPDRTVIGRAKFNEDKTEVLIEIPDGDVVQTLIGENLIGLSIVYQGAIPTKEEKPTDG